MKLYDIYLKHPFTMVIAGPSGSGKTMWIKKLIENISSCSFPIPEKITYFYGEYQDIFNSLNNVTFISGLSENILSNLDGAQPELFIIDDLMNESANSKIVSELFTKKSHHKNCSVILIIQNFFVRGSESRNISLNCNYFVLFKNPRDRSVATYIGRQMFPSSIRKFRNIFEDATSKPYSYLFIDTKSQTPDEVRLLTDVLGEKHVITAYQI